MRNTVAVLFVALSSGGCGSDSLQRRLAERGVVYDRCPKIVITGSEADFGPISVTLRSSPEVQEVWDTIIPGRPFGIWYASGYRRVACYTHEDSDRPAATLLVNASGAAHIEGAAKIERFYCPGLHPLAMKLLGAEFDRQRRASRRAASGPSPPGQNPHE